MVPWSVVCFHLFSIFSFSFSLFFSRWEVADWGECSQSCGGGVKTRSVACIIDKDGKKVKVMKRRRGTGQNYI